MKLFLPKHLIIIFLFAVIQVPVYATELNSDKEIYISISEELSEIREMIELYVAIGEGLTYRNPRERLMLVVKKCNMLIKNLRQHYQSTEISLLIDTCEASWKEIRSHVESALTFTDMEKMHSEILYIHANLFKLKKTLLDIKKVLQPQMNKKVKKLLMASTVIGSAARTLSAHYYMEMWKLDDPTISNHWKKAVKKYEASLKTLRSSEFSKDERFKKLFIGVERDLLFFKVLWEFKQGSHTPSLISKKSKHAHHNALEMEKIILLSLPN